ncbi:hypothetical protein Sango_2389700 [Sesamum angolense]|uniref:Uncharacterized protein n=1 Tax=Sesamum angolense TaxID=2727404 RepID=A0AAE2BJN5_9LAMI|nr:hypothetical protein Sango_2389700 [Sesamum angolense]
MVLGVLKGQPLVTKVAAVAKYGVLPGAMIAALVYSPPDYALSKKPSDSGASSLVCLLFSCFVCLGFCSYYSFPDLSVDLIGTSWYNLDEFRDGDISVYEENCVIYSMPSRYSDPIPSLIRAGSAIDSVVWITYPGSQIQSPLCVREGRETRKLMLTECEI